MNLMCLITLGVFLFPNWAFATEGITFPGFAATVELEAPIPLNYTVKKVRVEGSALTHGNEINFVVGVDQLGRFNIPEYQMSCPGKCNLLSVKFSFLDSQDRVLGSISKEYYTQSDVSNWYRWHFDETVLQVLPETRIQFASPRGDPYLNFWDHLREIVKGTKYENLNKYDWAIYSDGSRTLSENDRGITFGAGISQKIVCPKYPDPPSENSICILFNNPEQASKDIYAEFVLFEGNRIWARRPVDRWDINLVTVGSIRLFLFERGTSKPVVRFLLDDGRIWHFPGANTTVFKKSSYDSPYTVRGRMIEY